MRKIILSLVAFFVASASADAQFYCRAGLGYAVAQAGQSIAGQEWPYSGFTNNGVLYKIDDASFSAGWQGYLSLGCMVNKHIGIQLDAGIGLSTQTLKFIYYDINGPYLNGYAVVEQRAKHPTNLIPTLVVKTGGDPWDVYCRMGIALPVYSELEKQYTISNANAKTKEVWQVHSSFSPGFTAAAGFEYKVSSVVSFWAEVSLLSMSLYVKEADLTGFSLNDRSIPLYWVNGTKNISYGKNVTLDSVDFSHRPAYTQPFSNLGINIGARLCTRARDKKQSR